MASFTEPLGLCFRDSDGLYTAIWILNSANVHEAAEFEIFDSPAVPPRGEGFWPDEGGSLWKRLLIMGYHTPLSLAAFYERIEWEDPDWRTPQYWEKIREELRRKEYDMETPGNNH